MGTSDEISPDDVDIDVTEEQIASLINHKSRYGDQKEPELEELKGYEFLTVKAKHPNYEFSYQGNTVKHKIGGDNTSFASTILSISDCETTLDEAIRENYENRYVKGKDLEPFTDELGYLLEELRDDFERLGHELHPEFDL